jgi:hypothetical protein
LVRISHIVVGATNTEESLVTETDGVSGTHSFNNTVSTEKKSQASIDDAWVERNSAQVGPLRIGDGSMPLRFRMVQTLEGARTTPVVANSPCIRQ